MLLFTKKVKTTDTRKYRRLRTFGLIKYRLANSSNRKTTMVNPREVSPSGASFISRENMQKDSLLEMEICLPQFKNFITVMAKVVRCAKIKGEKSYMVNICFTAIDPADKNRLTKHIEELAKDPAKQKYLDKKGQVFIRIGP